ncbi:hypothetical protein ZWY2020_033599 [Hordeum vulgare]|nr:hypothetical protein ZWY2020_033599 [Hordeum vulgare]
MDTLTRYAEADDTKDPGEDGSKANSPRKGKSSKNHSRFQGRAHHNHGGNGKRRQQEGSMDFVTNTNANNCNQFQKKRGYSGKKPCNYNEILKGPCLHHTMVEGPATHSWEDCYVMQEFRAEALKKGQVGDQSQRMNLLEKDLMPSTTVFHGIVPGKSAYPIGRVKLNVAFGTTSNHRSESLIFEVVKLKSPYHALFGRPAYARFMARPCYVYLKLKMPGPKGPIMVDGDRRIAKECEEGDAAYAEIACAAKELRYHQANVDPTDMSPFKKPTTDAKPLLKFKPTDDTKMVDFTPSDSSKQFTIGAGLDPK